MSIILGIQKRLTEVGRIRMGEKQGNRPVKLDNFRITSPNQSILGEVADRYGGNVTPWDDQYQVNITANEIKILLPMGDGIFSEWYEEWSRGGIQKRCTGEYDEVRDCPCDCVPGDRMCKPTSRLSMWLPEIESLGVWMLSSTGYNANAELGGTVQALQDAARALGRPVKATLSLEQRKKVSEGQTRRFAVPVIQPREPVERILEATQGTQQRLQAADRPDIPAIAPPPDDFADEPAYLQVDNPQQPFTRNPQPVEKWNPNKGLETWNPEGEPEGEITGFTTVRGNRSDVIPDNWRKQVVIAAREIGLSDEQRHDMVHYITKGRTRSSKELLESELPAMWDRLTTSASSQALKLMNDIWSDPTTAYSALHKVEGLERDVKTWQFNEWKLVITHCVERITHSQQQDEKLS